MIIIAAFILLIFLMAALSGYYFFLRNVAEEVIGFAAHKEKWINNTRKEGGEEYHDAFEIEKYGLHDLLPESGGD
jgi:hypothetical protein